jgi:cation diffusion facilitator CzcD-associated flavoprotein CzcO
VISFSFHSHNILFVDWDMDSPEELDVIIIGAGLSGWSTLAGPPTYFGTTLNISTGICALTRVREKLPNASVAVFEIRDHVGGTWAKNTYPGLSCDIPSQVRTNPPLFPLAWHTAS